jgi:hypothetical protein
MSGVLVARLRPLRVYNNAVQYIRTYIHVSELSGKHPKVFQTLHV